MRDKFESSSATCRLSPEHTSAGVSQQGFFDTRNGTSETAFARLQWEVLLQIRRIQQ